MAILRADPSEAVVLMAMLKRADRHVFDYQKRQAVLIASEVGRVIAKMFK